MRAFLNRAGERMWPGRSRRPPAPEPPPVAATHSQQASPAALFQAGADASDSDGEDDDGVDSELESENLAAVVATPRPHAPLNGASEGDARLIASGGGVGSGTTSGGTVSGTSGIGSQSNYNSKVATMSSSSSTATDDSIRKVAQKSRMELMFQVGDDPAALAARLKGRKFSTPENFISRGPVSRRKAPSGGSNFDDLVEEEELGTVGGFRRTVSTSALRLQNRSLFWKAL